MYAQGTILSVTRRKQGSFKGSPTYILKISVSDTALSLIERGLLRSIIFDFNLFNLRLLTGKTYFKRLSSGSCDLTFKEFNAHGFLSVGKVLICNDSGLHKCHFTGKDAVLFISPISRYGVCLNHKLYVHLNADYVPNAKRS